MIPHTYPSTLASNGQRQMVVYFLTSIAGLTRWLDYIPVKLSQGGKENSYDNDGFIDIVALTSLTSQTQAWKEYIPVYVDNSATDAWRVNATGYIPYAYARFGTASLILDFTNGGALDSRVTFTRSSTATRTNASGVLVSAAINAPRFDYDPVTLAPKGLLIEEQRTNLLLQSEVFSNAAWNAVITVTLTSGIAAPNGTNNAFTATATGANSVLGQFVTASTGVYSASFWIRRRTGTGEIAISAGPNSPIPVTVDSTWRRVSVTNTAATTTVRAYLHIAVSGDAVDVFGAQLEAGSFATSYIPTTTAATTRAADVATMTGTNFSNWYNQTEGTFYVEPTLAGTRTTDCTLFRADDGTSSNRLQTGTGSSFTILNSFIITAGASQGNNTASVAPTLASKAAFAFAANSSVTAANGITGTTDVSVTVPSTLNRFMLGRDDTAGYLNGHIRRIAYYPRRLANTELQVLTS